MFPLHYLGLCLVCWGWFYQFVDVDSTIWLPYPLVSTDFGTCSYQCFLYSCTPVSLHMLKCSWAHTLSCLFVYCSFASIGHADMWSIVSSNCWQSLHLLSVSVFNIFVAYYFICNTWSCAATISLSVSAFRSPFDSQRNVSSLLMSCLCIFLIYCPCITLFFHFSFKTSLSLSFVCCVPSLFT